MFPFQQVERNQDHKIGNLLVLGVKRHRSSLYTEICTHGSSKRWKLESCLSSHIKICSNPVSQYQQRGVDNETDEYEKDEEDEERLKYSSKLQSCRRAQYGDIEALDVAKSSVSQSKYSAYKKGCCYGRLCATN